MPIFTNAAVSYRYIYGWNTDGFVDIWAGCVVLTQYNQVML
jgi:hypothetical protein